jgi:hypothetical protein
MARLRAILERNETFKPKISDNEPDNPRTLETFAGHDAGAEGAASEECFGEDEDSRLTCPTWQSSVQGTITFVLATIGSSGSLVRWVTGTKRGLHFSPRACRELMLTPEWS